MKQVFVLSLRDGFDADAGLASGYVEDVLTGKEESFHSIEELLSCLQQFANPPETRQE